MRYLLFLLLSGCSSTVKAPIDSISTVYTTTCYQDSTYTTILSNTWVVKSLNGEVYYYSCPEENLADIFATRYCKNNFETFVCNVYVNGIQYTTNSYTEYQELYNKWLLEDSVKVIINFNKTMIQ